VQHSSDVNDHQRQHDDYCLVLVYGDSSTSLRLQESFSLETDGVLICKANC